MAEMLTFNLVALCDWMNDTETLGERMQSVLNLLDDASIRRIPFERLDSGVPSVYVTVDLDVVRRKAYYHCRITKVALEQLIGEMVRLSNERAMEAKR